MPKKFSTENPKVTAARDRKNAAKNEEADKKQKAADDKFWADDDKLANRKLQRKDEEEKKRLELQKRKEENRELAEQEMNNLTSKKVQPEAKKVTRAVIEQRKEKETLIMKELEEQRNIEAQKIQVAGALEENFNQLDITTSSARNVDEALEILGDSTGGDVDNHPEKRMRAAYLTFEERRLPELKLKHPTHRLSQLKQVLKKEWQKSPDNPLNARILALSK